MINRSFRRANLISPFGPGAISITTSGAALMTAGLDAWPNTDTPNFDSAEFKFGEWRLQKQLGVDYFMLPPDNRQSFNQAYGQSQQKPNLNLTIPVLRFPTWFVCSSQSCGRLIKRSLATSDTPICSDCDAKKKHKIQMTQVQFIAFCEDGHIQDFPWNEWIHREAQPQCSGKLRLKGSGSASLASRSASCDLCGRSRSLGSILGGPSKAGMPSDNGNQEAGLSFLSQHLAKDGQKFLCQGHRPWLGDLTGGHCNRPLQGTLRGATNVYYPSTRSAIYVPSTKVEMPEGLIELLETGRVHNTFVLFKSLRFESENQRVEALRGMHTAELFPFNNQQILHAMKFLDEPSQPTEASTTDTAETGFRRLEFEVLSSSIDHDKIRVRVGHVSKTRSKALSYLTKVNLVERLTETRVFNGFSRIIPKDNISNNERDKLIWKVTPEYGRRWLPAYQVFGEGLFLEFDESKLREWERRPDVRARAALLDSRVRDMRAARSLEPKPITPRFLMLHSAAHLLINQLVFHSGYSSASLRERLFVSDNPDNPMGGILIYTASGDSDGTLGGLVRLGTPETLEGILVDAVRSASWCSGDPVCMELGASGGQGPDSCNLAACHSCSLLPETSCEEFNRYLDRWMLVGDPTHPESGFFSNILSSIA